MQQPIKITCYSLQISAPAILFSFQSIPTLLQRSMVLFVVKGEARIGNFRLPLVFSSKKQRYPHARKDLAHILANGGTGQLGIYPAVDVIYVASLVTLSYSLFTIRFSRVLILAQYLSSMVLRVRSN
ncbi:uncharacterized protein LOC117211410 isoform X3 [Bombus bifarius]|uniref:Uncharacterized protein LOC117211410 isoform X3 n=1 Tax=Bombus bifarius TaxID=103933 RepID=A0A6P8MRR5_9HYME|nr:uncharacterized protein LOC117211410 isoform X3 [Bombus bifarius]